MSQDDEKKQRLAQALRSNLRRRKAQARGERRDGEPAKPDAPERSGPTD